MRVKFYKVKNVATLKSSGVRGKVALVYEFKKTEKSYKPPF